MPILSPNPDQPSTAPPLAGAVRFAIFEFDFATSELRRNGILVRLQAQPARVLAYLLAHTGRIVSREELHDTIWGASTFVDFERGLNVCIAQIRAALGDESTTPRYIRTIPRKGYEFVCPVQKVETSPNLGSAHAPALPRNSRRLLFASIAALLISAALAGYLAARSRLRSTPITVAVARFDNETGDPQLDRFSDALTDDVVAQLTTGANRLHIIGNAAVLRTPRQRRDLKQIASELHSDFVILGQIQRIGPQTRILAHLIRLADQTHVWVVRLDRPFDNPAALETAAARQITFEFSAKLANPSALPALHAAASH